MSEKLRIKLALAKTTPVTIKEIKNRRFIAFWEEVKGEDLDPGEMFVECSIYNFDQDTADRALECVSHYKHGDNAYLVSVFPKYVPMSFIKNRQEGDKVMIFDAGYDVSIELVFDQVHSKYAQLGTFTKLSERFSK